MLSLIQIGGFVGFIAGVFIGLAILGDDKMILAMMLGVVGAPVGAIGLLVWYWLSNRKS